MSKCVHPAADPLSLGPATIRPQPLSRNATLFLVVASLLASCGSESAPAPSYPHVLFITLDTTRADHLGVYGNQEVKTPALDSLGAEGTVFERCVSAAATTLASHTSLLTGTYPLSHGVRRNGFFVGEENVLLAEVLSQAGFYCAAFLGSSALTHKSDLVQGFDHYSDDFSLKAEGGKRDQDQRTAAEVTSALLEHVDEVLARQEREADFPERLFLMAHYFDPHAPYAPSKALAQRYGAVREVGDFAAIETAVVAQQRRVLGDAQRDFGQQAVIRDGMTEQLLREAPGVPTKIGRDLSKLYAGEVTATDGAIGSLLAGLSSRGILEDTLVVVTADHGETFWEHGNFWNHGLWVSETDVHVPLIIRFPDGRGAGRRVEMPVSGVDVMPTLLEALDLQPPTATDNPAAGRSVLASIDGLAQSDRVVFCEATQPGPSLEEPSHEGAGQGAPLGWGNARKPQAARLGDWKLVEAPYLDLKQLFHLGRDPAERNDLLQSGALDPAARAALAELELAFQRWRASASPKPSTYDVSQTVDLRGLGYGEAGAEEDESRK